MTALGLRARFALLAAALVLVIASAVGAGGYLVLRHALLARADREARGQAQQLAGLVDVGGPEQPQANQVEISDPSLIHGFARGGLRVSALRTDGRVIQANGQAPGLPERSRRQCVSSGSALVHLGHPEVAIACARVGSTREPTGLIAVAAPLADERQALARLAAALAIGVAAGTVLAAVLARSVAHRALRPARQIASAAEAIRGGALNQRIEYRGPRDELGELADILDASFAELEQAVQHQRRFVADASHELRTPIATIRAHAELLRGWAGQSPPARSAALAAIDQASRTAGRLVADLLYLARLDRLPAPMRLPTQLDQIVIDAVREAQPLRPEVPISVEHLDETRLSADELALRRVLVNLIANALRMSPHATGVRVALRRAGVHATVTVSDRGPGIPADQLERIFERFRTTTSPRSGHPGLGLAIAREIARAHGGDVRARNDPGGGAVFTVDLPLTERAPGSG